MSDLQRPDIIVVGAGSAGCVLADRLSQRGISVIVLEAGPDITPGQTPDGIDGNSFFAALEEPGRRWPDLVAQRVSDKSAVNMRGDGEWAVRRQSMQ